MTSEERIHLANEINGLWVRHIKCGEKPPDLRQVARIIKEYEAIETAGAVSQKRRPRLFLIR